MRALVPPVAVLAAVALSAQGGGTSGPAPGDPCPVVYPGDTAAKSRLARWMARGAAIRSLPGELPAMAALAETEMANIRSPDRRYVGFFQMDIRGWNRGPYRGYPRDPELQLRWFTDHAVLVRQRAIAEGDAGFGQDEDDWGRWVGVVENPGAPAVEHYARRLEQARALVGGDCRPAGFVPDTAPPVLRARAKRRQRRTLSVRVRCPAEDCMAAAAAYDRAGRRRGRARARAALAGEAITLTLTTRRTRSLRVQATAVDEAGNASSITRAIVFTR